MKKILLASTMLVGTAGFAAAEVTLSGDGRMGITYNEAFVGNEMAFNSRARVTFKMSGETDGGLSFGATFRADNAAASPTVDLECLFDAPTPEDAEECFGTAGGAVNGAAGSVFISGAFGKLSMGDVSSAAENAVGDLVGVGYTGIGDGNEMIYLTTGDNEMALYEYSAGSFTGYASLGQPDNRGTLDETTYSVGAKYSTDAFTVAAGYEKAGDVNHAIIGASATFSGVTVEGIYGKASGDFEQYGIGASYTADALTVKAYWSTDNAGVGGADRDFYGIGADYALGGGAVLKGGIADFDGTTRADLGVTFSF